MDKLLHMLPFIEKEELKELAEKIINGEVKGLRLHMLFPFLEKADLDKIIDLLIEKDKGSELQYAIPFISEEKIDEIYQGIKEGKITGIKETRLYPFLGKNKLKEMFHDLVKQAEKEAKENSEGMSEAAREAREDLDEELEDLNDELDDLDDIDEDHE